MRFLKLIACFLGIVLLFLVLFLAMKYVDILVNRIIVGQYSCSPDQGEFEIYKDFVTFSASIIGMLAGLGSLLAYVSFKEFREKYEKLSCDFEKKNTAIAEKCTQLEELARAHEVLMYRNADRGSSLIISELMRLQKNSESARAYICVLIGDEYFALGSNFYGEARKYYRKALKEDSCLARAIYGLALVDFKIVLSESLSTSGSRTFIKKSAEQIDLGRICLVGPKVLHNKSHTLIVKRAMENMLLAKQHGYMEDECYLQRGKMAECLDRKNLALESYESAIGSNKRNYEAILCYCIAKIRIKNIESWGEEEKNKVVELLKNVASLSLMLSKLAYALLWYIYKKTGNLEGGDEAWEETTSFALNEMFTFSEDG